MHRSGLLSALVECLVSLSVFVPPLPLLPFCLFIVLALYIFIHSSHIAASFESSVLRLCLFILFVIISGLSLQSLSLSSSSSSSSIIVSPQPCLNRDKTPSTQSSCPFINSLSLSISQSVHGDNLHLSLFVSARIRHHLSGGSSAQQEGLSARSNDIPHLR